MRKRQIHSNTAAARRRTRRVVTGAFLAATIVVGAVAYTDVAAISGSSAAGDQAQNAPGQQKKYKATRPLVVDNQTSALRLPTADELQQTVDSLAALTTRDLSSAQVTPSSVTGWSTLDVSSSAGVIVARPKEDGTMETRCVFTLEEGLAFLGVVEDVQ